MFAQSLLNRINGVLLLLQVLLILISKLVTNPGGSQQDNGPAANGQESDVTRN